MAKNQLKWLNITNHWGNQNQMGYHLIPIMIDTMKKISKRWRGCAKWGSLCTVGEDVKWCSHYGKVWCFLKKFKIEIPSGPATSIWVYTPNN